MATLWKYSASIIVTNPAFANQLWAVLWSTAPASIRGENSNTFNALNAYRTISGTGPAPLAYVIHTALQQPQRDELYQFFVTGTNPQRWLDAGLTNAQLNQFRSSSVASIGLRQDSEARKSQ